MRPTKAAIALPLCLAALLAAPAAHAQMAVPGPTEIPSAIRLQHADDVEKLSQLTHRLGEVGQKAAAALELLKRHHAREVAYILPPLTLIPLLAAGKFSPEMKWAIPMADKLDATREEVFQEHTAITEVMTELYQAAQKADDVDAAEFAESAVADSVADMELQEPASVLVGVFLRAKFAAVK